MSFAFKKVAIIGRHYKKEVSQTLERLWYGFSDLSLDVTIEENSARDVNVPELHTMSLKDIALSCDVAIVVGGDANFIQASRVLAIYSDIPVIGVNKGNLGFLTTISPKDGDVIDQLYPMLKGEVSNSSMSMLKCVVDNDDAVSLEKSIALNEITISASRGQMFGLKVCIDNRYAFDQRGDGLIIASPTGSTAHAMSAGGPILAPNQDSMVIVPICSHSLSSRPIVIPDHSKIDILVTDYNNAAPVLSIDGRHDVILHARQKLTITKSDKKVRVLHPAGYNHFETLRKKLGWGRVLF